MTINSNNITPKLKALLKEEKISYKTFNLIIKQKQLTAIELKDLKYVKTWIEIYKDENR